MRSEERCEQQNYKLDFDVRKGMKDGDVVPFARAGEQRPGRIPGDVNVKVKIASKAEVRIAPGAAAPPAAAVATELRRKGKDLHAELKISLKESLLGFSRRLTHLDGQRRQLVMAASQAHNVARRCAAQVPRGLVAEAVGHRGRCWPVTHQGGGSSSASNPRPHEPCDN